MTDHQAITNLFTSYLAAFKRADKAALSNAYFLPCSLSTPTEVKFIRQKVELDEVITEILMQIEQSQTQNIDICSLSYEQLNTNQYIACAHWQFKNHDKQVFADFCAFYHIEIKQDKVAFRHVISHENDQLKTFVNTIEITDLYK